MTGDTSPLQDERAAFEAWCKSEGHDSRIYGDGNYADEVTPLHAAYIAGSAASQAREKALRDALTELVECKRLKDNAEAVHFAGPLSTFGEGWKAEYDRLRADYIKRQPEAWDVARKALEQS